MWYVSPSDPQFYGEEEAIKYSNKYFPPYVVLTSSQSKRDSQNALSTLSRFPKGNQAWCWISGVGQGSQQL